MDSLQDYLVELSDRLDTDGKQVCADAVDDLIKTASLQKLAQYVGVIGYVLKQNRAMGNCIRKKRASSNEPMQTVVMQCLKEYQDGQNYQNTEWASKYAQVIKQDPQKFDVSHLFFLSTVGEMGDIKQHIERVEKVAGLLKENEVEEPVFNTILGHLSTFGDILSKDSETHVNFKVAAPQRGWWSRFWNPTQFSLTNPRSWFKGVRERGQDLDAIQELESVLTNLSALTRITQQIRTGIARLKSEVNGYTSGSGQELNPTRRQPAMEDEDIINTLVQKTMGLQEGDWNRSMLLLQQMRYLLNKSRPKNQYNRQIFDRAKQSVDRIFGSMEEVYSLLESIQGDMETLRTREPILGRDLGLTEQGERNPFGITSPAEEYGALQQVLEKLYENPMDPKAQWYAQKAHARLWDKLRYIQRGSDEGMDDWLSQKREYPSYGEPQKEDEGLRRLQDDLDDPTEFSDWESTQKPDGGQQDITPPPGQEAHRQLSPEQEEQFNKLKEEDILYLLEKGKKGQLTANDLLTLVSYIHIILDGPEERKVGELFNKMKDFLDPSGSGGEVVGGNANAAEESPSGYTRLSKSIVRDLIRIADAADRVDRDVADVLDAFIEEQKSNKIGVLFPEFGVPVKEHTVEEKNNTI